MPIQSNTITLTLDIPIDFAFNPYKHNTSKSELQRVKVNLHSIRFSSVFRPFLLLNKYAL